MANQLLTIGMITREFLRILMNNTVFAAKANREYDDQFARTGAKIGSVVNIRKPVRWAQTSGQGLQLQDVTETSVPLALTTQAQRSFVFSSADMALSIDDFAKRYLRTAAISMANQVDADGLKQYVNVFNVVGTPGTTPNALLTYLTAMQRLNEEAAPQGDRMLCISPAMQAVIVDALKGLFQASTEIASQYKTGKMGETAGADWYMDQNIQTATIGPLGGAPVVNGAGQTGSSLVTNGWTAAAALRLNQGDVFTLAGVFAVNPQSQQSTGSLRNFVVTAPVSSDGAGNATIPIYPAIVTSGAYQTVTASPANGAALTVYGAANTATPQGIAFHPDAFTLGSADLELPEGVAMASRIGDRETGLSMRAVKAYDINMDRYPCRLDFLYGWATLYPELACRVAS